MLLEMKVPSPGESILEVEIAEWLVEDGDYVEKDQSIAEIDSDKATLELPAEESGVIKIVVGNGETVAVGDVVCVIDTSAKGEAKSTKKEVGETPKVDVKSVTDLKGGKATPLASAIIGAHDIFLGQVRADEIDGKTVTAIDYSAYDEMANKVFDEIREAAFEKFDLTCGHIYHSKGIVKAGEICLFVFTSSKHRQMTFDATRYITEEIKVKAPVFGKEIFEDETHQWKVNK